jgi:mannose-1-phosphate guanylyltransferase
VPDSRRIFPVILAGGSGTRFWPLSRRRRPKQLLPLASRKALVVDTVERLDGLAPTGNFLVVCGKAHAAAIRRLLPRLARRGVLVEPAARNTAPAVALAALAVSHRDPQGILVVTPSDHGIRDVPGFREAIQVAASAAEKGALVTIGIRPTRPETGFGYVKVGEAHPREKRARKALAFVEKPDRAKAESYVRSGDYLWNAGMFVLRADRVLEEVRRHLPAAAKALDHIAPTLGTRGLGRAIGRWFPEMPSISFDYAVMEKAEDIAVVPASIGWSDLGSFAALPEVREADAQGNVVSGDVITVDAARNVVVGGKRLVAVVGVSDLVVVDAGDAILVVHRDRAQDVRKVTEALAARGDEDLL